MSAFMTRTELEIKKDQLISSQSALVRLTEMHTSMQQALLHVQKVVSFMTFDEDSQ